MNSKEESELTLHLLSSDRSGSGRSHGHVGGVRGSGCRMGMGSSDCGTVGCLLGLVVVGVAQLRQCRRGHVRRGKGIRIRVPWKRREATKRGETNVNMLFCTFGDHPRFFCYSSPIMHNCYKNLQNTHTEWMMMSGGTNGQKMNNRAAQNMTKTQGRRI